MEPKKFTFDYSYWSHDGFSEREDGYLYPTEPRYADQVSNGGLDLQSGKVVYLWFLIPEAKMNIYLHTHMHTKEPGVR